MIGRIAFLLWIALLAPALAQPAGGILLYDLDRDAYVAQRLGELEGALRDAFQVEPAIAAVAPDEEPEAEHVRIAVPADRLDEAFRRARAVAKGAEGFEVVFDPAGFVGFRVDGAALPAVLDRFREAVLAVMSRRLAERAIAGAASVSIGGLIRVEVSQATDLDALDAYLRTVAELGFHVVEATAYDFREPPKPAHGGVILADAVDPELFYEIRRMAAVSGNQIVGATVTTDTYAGEPIVQFRLDNSGRAALRDVTGDNVGRQMAIVLDGTVLSAPHIREAITGGTGVIQGGFSREEAERLAALISAGALPIPVLRVSE